MSNLIARSRAANDYLAQQRSYGGHTLEFHKYLNEYPYTPEIANTEALLCMAIDQCDIAAIEQFNSDLEDYHAFRLRMIHIELDIEGV